LADFYLHFLPRLEETSQADRVKGERELGIDPKSGKPVVAKIGKYGPYVQIGSREDEEKPTFAQLKKGQLIATITLDEALKLFDLPRKLGSYEDTEVVANVGRFGPYVKHKNLFASIPKDEDPYDIEIDRAIELIEEKRKKEREKYINSFEHEGDKIEVLNGRWGPYIKFKKKNFKIPKGTDAKSLTKDEIIKLIENPPKKTKKAASRKKKK